jgi:large conductance mechanosensitive channel
MKSIKGFFAEFQKFASRGNFIDLAVGIVIGTSFNTVATSLVTNIITPPLGLLLGKINFVDLAIPLGGTVKITYGIFVQAVLTFILTVLALFLIVRFINRVQDLALRRKQQEASAPPTPADSPELSVLKEIRDAIKPRSEETENIEPEQEPIT